MGRRHSNSCFVWMIITLVINVALVATSKFSDILPYFQSWTYAAIGINAACFAWFIYARVKECHYADVYAMITANVILTISYLGIWFL